MVITKHLAKEIHNEKVKSFDKGLEQGKTETLNEEIDFLEKFKKGLEYEITIANEKDDLTKDWTNARQSILVMRMSLTQINKRLEFIKQKLLELEGKNG